NYKELVERVNEVVKVGHGGGVTHDAYVDIVWKLLVLQSGGLPAGIHGLFSGWYCILASRRVTCEYPWPGLRGSLIPLSRGSFDVIVGIDWLSKRRFGIVCYKKVVRISLEGDEIFRVHRERTLGAAKALMNAKVDEPRISLVHGATPIAKSPYRLASSKMQELSGQLQELQDKGFT
ncbi:hypothetical protein Tco_1416977, partial [Tanacetum coccineum]